MGAAMWNLSYGRVAADRLDADRAAAAHAALLAQLPGPSGRRHPARQALGELFIRIGARLVMPAAPSTVR